MPGLHRKKNHYYGVFYGPDRRPRQKWIALRTTNRKAATAKLRELEVLQAVGEYDPWNDASPKETSSLGEAIGTFLKARAREDLQPATLRADRSVLTRLSGSIAASRAVSSISEREMAGFFAQLRDEGAKDTTLQAYHTRLKFFFDWCRNRGLVREHPVEGLKRPRQAAKTPRFLSEEEVARLLVSIRSIPRDRWLEDVVTVAVGTGMRISELCEMRRDWVGLSPPAVTVKRSATYRPKSGSERHIPVAGDAEAALTRLFGVRRHATDRMLVDAEGRPLRPNRVSKAFKRHLRRAGLSEEYSFHVLRHTFASWLVRAGTDLYRVRDLLGHQSIEVTERYAHLKPEDLRRAVEKTFGAACG
jgi:integrase/recombinase XerC